jgi:hypothetical protein
MQILAGTEFAKARLVGNARNNVEAAAMAMI